MGTSRTIVYLTGGFRRETPGASGPIARSHAAIHSFRFTMDGHRPTEIIMAITSTSTIFRAVAHMEMVPSFQIIHHRRAVPLVVLWSARQVRARDRDQEVQVQDRLLQPCDLHLRRDPEIRIQAVVPLTE